MEEERFCATHPERPAVSTCAICGDAVCEQCEEQAGGNPLCGRHASVPLIEGWAQVYATSDDVVAQLIRDNLRAAGVDAQVFSQKDHFAFAVDLGDLSPVRVLVPAEEYEAAQRIVREHMDLHGEVRFACPNCGEPAEPGATRCAACGAPLS
ncbi:MAG: DUF2007 domain-containing protein [bacterium]